MSPDGPTTRDRLAFAGWVFVFATVSSLLLAAFIFNEFAYGERGLGVVLVWFVSQPAMILMSALSMRVAPAYHGKPTNGGKLGVLAATAAVVVALSVMMTLGAGKILDAVMTAGR